MESINIWLKNGLIVRHCGKLTASGMMVNIQNILENPRLDRIKYTVMDCSDVSEIDVGKPEADEIGALVHDLLGFHGLLNQKIRWAVATKDRRIEQFVRIMAERIGDAFNLKMFSDPKEAQAWADGSAQARKCGLTCSAAA